jgi:hypothetical protein
MSAIEAEYREKYIPKPLLTAQQGTSPTDPTPSLCNQTARSNGLMLPLFSSHDVMVSGGPGIQLPGVHVHQPEHQRPVRHVRHRQPRAGRWYRSVPY